VIAESAYLYGTITTSFVGHQAVSLQPYEVLSIDDQPMMQLMNDRFVSLGDEHSYSG
jgi:hypothetical protein